MILESIKYLQPAVCSASLEENSHLYTNVLQFWGTELGTQPGKLRPVGNKYLDVLETKNLNSHCRIRPSDPAPFSSQFRIGLPLSARIVLSSTLARPQATAQDVTARRH